MSKGKAPGALVLAAGALLVVAVAPAALELPAHAPRVFFLVFGLALTWMLIKALIVRGPIFALFGVLGLRRRRRRRVQRRERAIAARPVGKPPG